MRRMMSEDAVQGHLPTETAGGDANPGSLWRKREKGKKNGAFREGSNGGGGES